MTETILLASLMGLTVYAVSQAGSGLVAITDYSQGQAHQKAQPEPPPTRIRPPQAAGRDFATLDAYLDHLRRYAAPMDRPWYREVSPDMFLLETGNLRTGAPPRLFTREQLERRFGFRP